MRVLVTGGNGFIGSHVVERLLHLGHHPVIFDRRQIPADVEVFFGDVVCRESVSEAVSTCDGVIHLAGILGTSETVNNPFPSVTTNIIGSLNVFEACVAHKIRGVCISVGNHWMNNPYSITKSCVERFALSYNKDRGAKIAVVRGMNAYGPRQKLKPVRKMLPNFVVQGLRKEHLLIYGDGTQKMDMIYVVDLAKILVRALIFNHGCYGAVFEAGTGVAPTVTEIAYDVLAATDNPPDNVRYVKMRKGEIPNSTVVADTKTLEPLGEIDFTPWPVGLAKTVEWYKSQECSGE